MSIHLKDRPAHHRFIVLVQWEHDPPQCWRADLRHDTGALIATAAADQPRDAVLAALDKAAADRRGRTAPKPTPKRVAVTAVALGATECVRDEFVQE